MSYDEQTTLQAYKHVDSNVTQVQSATQRQHNFFVNVTHKHTMA